MIPLPRKVVEELFKLPLNKEAVWEGGRRPLPVWIRHHDGSYHPDIVLWADSASGYIFQAEIIEPWQSEETTTMHAVMAMLKPDVGFRPGTLKVRSVQMRDDAIGIPVNPARLTRVSYPALL